MKTATVRDLRNNFAKISRWLKDDENVEITSKGIPIATLTPKPPPSHLSKLSEKERKAAFRKRFGAYHVRWMKKVYGGKVLPGNAVLRMREEKKW